MTRPRSHPRQPAPSSLPTFVARPSDEGRGGQAMRETKDTNQTRQTRPRRTERTRERHHGDRSPPDNEKRALTRTFVSGENPFRRFLLVREGGVEPPRPCGHWNLNPARLPIPPPAHWVLPPRPSPVRCERLATCRRLARCGGRFHISCFGRLPAAEKTAEACRGGPRTAIADGDGTAATGPGRTRGRPCAGAAHRAYPPGGHPRGTSRRCKEQRGRIGSGSGSGSGTRRGEEAGPEDGDTENRRGTEEGTQRGRRHSSRVHLPPLPRGAPRVRDTVRRPPLRSV